jgi:type IV pilus assembly protein PilV
MKTMHPISAGSGRSARRSSGFTLIEVLVTVLIMSLGMLGIAALQATTSRFKIGAWARSSTAVLFSDFADRVRANPDVAGLSYFSSGAATSTSAYALTTDWSTQSTAAAPTVTTDCSTTTCTATERAAYDLIIWRQQIRRQLPQGSAFVTGNRATGMTVTMMWFDKQFLKADNTLETSNACNAVVAGTFTSAALSNCCPNAAGVAAGVRCVNFTFLP